MNFLSKLLYTPPKVKASNDFMRSIELAKKEAQDNIEMTKDSFDNNFQDAVMSLEDFSNTQSYDKLKKAAKEFLILIKQKPSRVEPYVYLSYILYLYDQKEEAIKYIKIAQNLAPDYIYLNDVKACIYC